MSAWRVAAWDRELARGTITSALGTLPFDAAVAMTDDFRIGEEVVVTLRPDASTHAVVRIAPVEWRAPEAPRVQRPDHQAALAIALPLIRDRTLRLRGLVEEALTIEIEPESYEPSRALVLDACVWIQMPTEMPDVAGLSAYALGDFVRERSDLSAHWPALDPTLTVFRFEPRGFGHAAGYVVARGLRVVP